MIQNESLFSDLEKIRNNILINSSLITTVEKYFDINNKLLLTYLNIEIDNIIDLRQILNNLQNKFELNKLKLIYLPINIPIIKIFNLDFDLNKIKLDILKNWWDITINYSLYNFHISITKTHQELIKNNFDNIIIQNNKINILENKKNLFNNNILTENFLITINNSNLTKSIFEINWTNDISIKLKNETQNKSIFIKWNFLENDTKLWFIINEIETMSLFDNKILINTDLIMDGTSRLKSSWTTLIPITDNEYITKYYADLKINTSIDIFNINNFFNNNNGAKTPYFQNRPGFILPTQIRIEWNNDLNDNTWWHSCVSLYNWIDLYSGRYISFM